MPIYSSFFYNLLMAGAAWLLIDAADQPTPLVRPALGAMLLCGLAMTIKQVSFVEGAYFGLAFLWLMRRRDMDIWSIAAKALMMIAVALMPTALMLAGYALAGREDAFLFATVTSIFLKSGWGARSEIAGLLFFFVHLAPLLFMAVGGAVMRHRRSPNVRDMLLAGWIGAALLGYAAVPHFFEHYALPVIVPLAVSAATFFDRSTGLMYFAALAAFCVIIAPPIRDRSGNRQSRIEFERLTVAVNEARQDGCIYIGDGPTRLYSTTGACQVTRYLLPDHLNLTVERDAVGVDTRSELGAILARRPAAIVTRDRKRQRYSNAYRDFLGDVRRQYRNSYTSPEEAPAHVRSVRVWQRKDLATPTS